MRRLMIFAALAATACSQPAAEQGSYESTETIFDGEVAIYLDSVWFDDEACGIFDDCDVSVEIDTEAGAALSPTVETFGNSHDELVPMFAAVAQGDELVATEEVLTGSLRDLGRTWRLTVLDKDLKYDDLLADCTGSFDPSDLFYANGMEPLIRLDCGEPGLVGAAFRVVGTEPIDLPVVDRCPRPHRLLTGLERDSAIEQSPESVETTVYNSVYVEVQGEATSALDELRRLHGPSFAIVLPNTEAIHVDESCIASAWPTVVDP